MPQKMAISFRDRFEVHYIRIVQGSRTIVWAVVPLGPQLIFLQFPLDFISSLLLPWILGFCGVFGYSPP